MARYSRKQILEDGAFFHVTWRCHNKDFYIKGHFEKKLYYDLLVKYKNDYNLEFYSYCFMNNHIHLVGKCNKVTELSNFFRKVNSIFSRTINKINGRCGQLIMDRFKSPMIESNPALIRVSRYVDLNAYKANIVKHPKYYKWCSYKYYAYGVEDKLLTPSPAFIEFGNNDKERRNAYIEIIDELINNEVELNNQNYSLCYFIGDPAWVLQKYNALKNQKKQKNLELPDFVFT